MCTYRKLILNTLLALLIYPVSAVYSEEQIIAVEKLSEEITITFEAAPKDTLFNDSEKQLSEKDTDIHIEALVNWHEDISIEGQNPGGFIPYVNITTEIINENTNQKKIIELSPHVNLSDGFHYAKNIKLPGLRVDKYKIIFTIIPDDKSLTYHMDWKEKYSYPIFSKKIFEYSNLDFQIISESSRR